jgi:hypothetical protein
MINFKHTSTFDSLYYIILHIMMNLVSESFRPHSAWVIKGSQSCGAETSVYFNGVYLGKFLFTLLLVVEMEINEICKHLTCQLHR